MSEPYMSILGYNHFCAHIFLFDCIELCIVLVEINIL